MKRGAKNMKKEAEIKYEDAVSEIEQIARDMDNGNLDIDQLGEKLKRAQTLIDYCKAKLTKTEEDINKLIHAEEK